LSEKKENLPIINTQIKDPKMQTIGSDGTNYGVLSRAEALRMAQESGLDLVLMAERGSEGVPVVKIMDLGKELYERKKKQTEAKKHQKVIQIKEIKIRPKIGEHDFLTKVKQAIGFLKEGKRVKVTLCFRGRENISKEERGADLFDRVQQSFAEFIDVEKLISEKDMRMNQAWSRIYYLKSAK
jgi:translation initiation factor IF-3